MTQKPPFPNPSEDEAMEECVEELRDGARPRTVEEQSLIKLRREHRTFFQGAFEVEDAWAREGTTVRRMARYIGVFAKFFAETEGQRIVAWSHLERARSIVGTQCPVLLQSIQARLARTKKDDSYPRFKYCPGGEA